MERRWRGNEREALFNAGLKKKKKLDASGKKPVENERLQIQKREMASSESGVKSRVDYWILWGIVSGTGLGHKSHFSLKT